MTSALDSRAVRLLNQMGIDVWRLRAPGGSSAEAARADQGAEQAASAAMPVEAVRSLLGSSEASHEANARRERPQTNVRAPASRPAPGPAVAPFAVLCLSREDAVLLVEPGDARAARRFAADLLAAAAGAWGGDIQQLAFEWPQPGIDPSAPAVARALGAFVGKQIADHPAALVIVGAEIAERLEPGMLPEGCLILPPFSALMTDAALKRALWRDLGERRST